MSPKKRTESLIRTIAILSLSILLWRCANDDVPLLTGIAVPTALPTSVAPTPTSTSTARADLAGDFRVVPAPDAAGVIYLMPGDSLEVNGALFRNAHGEGLKLGADWGDGSQGGSLCGACRAAHVYTSVGRFTLTAAITDFARENVQRWTVQVGCAAPTSHGYDSGRNTYSWASVDGATSYNVYLKTVPNCTQLVSDEATKADAKLAGVSSPFDVSAFNRCNTCYYIGVTAVTGSCESEISSGIGFGKGSSNCI
jgi:hypothetical protein